MVRAGLLPGFPQVIIKIPNYRAPSRNETTRKHWAYYKQQRQEMSEMVLAALRGKRKPTPGRKYISIIAAYKNKPVDPSNLDDKIICDCLIDCGVLADDSLKEISRVEKRVILGKENWIKISVFG